MDVLIGCYALFGIFMLIFLGGAFLKDLLRSTEVACQPVRYRLNKATAIGVIIIIILFLPAIVSILEAL